MPHLPRNDRRIHRGDGGRATASTPPAAGRWPSRPG